MKNFEVFTGCNSELYFCLVDNSGKTILSSERYKQIESALNGIEGVKKRIYPCQQVLN